jgi:hypothetical protein
VKFLWRRGANPFVIAALLGGCVDAPRAPARVADLSVDYASFDHPTAVLPDTTVPTIAAAFVRAGDFSVGIGAFGLVRKLVSDSNQALANEAGLLDQFTVDGTAVAKLPCSASPTMSPAVSTSSLSSDSTQSPDLSAPIVSGEAGLLTFNLGVENSKVQRTLRGTAQHCELIVIGSSSLPTVSTGSADLLVDLGEDLALGVAVTQPILIQATNVRVDDGSSGTVLALAPGVDEVRMTGENGIQVLVQPSALGVSVTGTVVVTLLADGTMAVRDQQGTWTCTRDGTPCAFAASN